MSTEQSPLIRPADSAAPASSASSRRPVRRVVWLAALALVALAVAGGALVAARWAGADGDDGAASTSETTLEFGVPLGGPERRDGPWLRLRVAPARPGENAAVAYLGSPEGAPLDGEAPPVRIASASLDDPTVEHVAETRASGDEDDAVALPLDGDGWWRVTVTPTEPTGGEPLRAYLYVPDPNLYGTDAAAPPTDDPDARTLFDRGLAATAALHRVRYRELMADGLGHLADAQHAFNDGSDGQPPASFFQATDGEQTIIVGDRRWLGEPGAGWGESTGAHPVPPAEWVKDYDRATGFRLGGTETIDGERCRIVTFAVPEQVEPRRQAGAWYAWWVGEESGQVRRETMVSRFHYMIRDSSGFNGPLPIVPPVPAASPVASPMP